MVFGFDTEHHHPRFAATKGLCSLFIVSLISAVLLAPMVNAEESDSLPEAQINPEDDDANEEVEPGDSERTIRELLVDDFQIDESRVDDPKALETIADEASQGIEEAGNSAAESAQHLLEMKRISEVLERQLGNEHLPYEARQIIVQDLVNNRVHEARTTAEIENLETAQALHAELRRLADRHLELLESSSEDDVSQQRIDEAEQAHQDALQRVANAIKLEQEERDEEVRELLTRQRELAEELAELTNREGQQVRELDAERRQRADDFAESRSRINARIAELPPFPREETSREEIDPLFREVLQSRRRARRHFHEHRDEKEQAVERVEELRLVHQRALDQLERFRDTGEDSERVRRRHAIAQLRSELTGRELRMAQDIAEAHQKKGEFFRDRVQFYHESVEALLPLISDRQRSEFYSLRRDENWQDAFAAFADAASQIRRTVQDRVETATAAPGEVLSVALLLWIFGLLWRCLLFPVAFFVGREYSPRLVRLVTDALLSRRFFRRHAAFAIKGGEILGAMIKPALLFLATIVVVEYAASAWEELYLLRWAVNATFIYWMVMIAVKVLVLPRGHREGDESKRTSSDDDTNEIEDLIQLELSRATKIVVSTRVVVVFWLLAFYVPALVLHATGHNVVWRIVDRLAVWGLLAVVYAVLSTWRDDIADIFGQLASDRMPRAVTIVQEHKDRPWGVLLIGLASVYVTGRELARVGRTYFDDTKWNRRIKNFFFRKTIELQRRDRDDAAPEQEREIPADYRDLFADRPLVDEPFAIERTHILERIEQNFDEWHGHPRKGAVAVVAEQGLGKTTLFNQIYSRWEAEENRDVSFVQLNDKINECSEVCKFLSSFFGLDVDSENPRQIVQALLELPPRVLIIDDCHHLFLRRIGGFEAVDLFLTIVNRTDHHHFWLLSFNGYTWSYLNRVRYRGHFFSDVIELEGWRETEIQEMIQKRNELDDLPISFTELVVAHDEDEDADQHYEIVRTSNGYFRLLHEFSKGNPRVALTFWLRSLRLDSSSTLQVELFRRPSLATLKSLSDDYVFALAAITQHGSLRPAEIATIIHAYRGDCEMIVEYLVDSEIIDIDPIFRRASIRSVFLRAVTKTLQDANVLYT